MSYNVQSLDRAFGILERVVQSKVPIPIGVIAEDMGLHPSTMYRFARALEALHYLEFDVHGRLMIGPKIVVMGKLAQNSYPLFRKSSIYTADLANNVKEIVNLGVLKNDEVFYLDKQEPASSEMGLTVQAGEHAPLYATAMGKLFLSSFDRQRLIRYWETHEIRTFTENTIIHRHDMELELDTIKRNGYSLDNEEMVKGIKCLASPIFLGGEMVAAVSMSIPAIRLGEVRQTQLIERIMETAQRISESMDGSEAKECI